VASELALFFAKLSLQALLKNSTKKPLYIVNVFVLNGFTKREKQSLITRIIYFANFTKS
jgi:hypothetical protein